MVIRLSQYGTMLISRPAGRESYLAAKAYVLPKGDETIEIDFSGVKVMTPSWLDEFVTPLRRDFGDRVKLQQTDNPSALASLATIQWK